MNDKPISGLAEELLRREMDANPNFGAPQKPYDLGLPETPKMKPLSPETAALLGTLMDTASTYNFLKRGKGSESNAMWGPLNNHPEATALGVLGGGLAMKGARGLMRKAGWDGLADMLAGGIGSYQFGLGAQNFENTANYPRGISSDSNLRGKILRTMQRTQ